MCYTSKEDVWNKLSGYSDKWTSPGNDEKRKCWWKTVIRRQDGWEGVDKTQGLLTLVTEDAKRGNCRGFRAPQQIIKEVEWSKYSEMKRSTQNRRAENFIKPIRWQMTKEE